MTPDEKFVEERIRFWKTRIKIKRTILWTTDFKTFCDSGEINCQFSKSQVFGATDSKLIIFINIKKHKGDRKKLENTVLHELLHIKFPDESNKQISDRTSEILNEN